MTRPGYGLDLLAVLICLKLAFPAAADSLALRNYDNDPDLAAAMEYDRGETTDRPQANREKAEEYYLKYLEKDIPSFQKARVYTRLGALFTVESGPNNRPRDFEKGQAYLEKVLELEPERIDSATIRARSLLASLRELPREEIVRRRLDNYEWLLSLNEEKYKKLWLPLDPNQTEIRPITLQTLKNLVPMSAQAAATNAVYMAAGLPSKEELLLGIMERFPGTEIADLAKKVLDVPVAEAADQTAALLNDDPDIAQPQLNVTPAPVEANDLGNVEHEQPSEANSAEPVLAQASEGSGREGGKVAYVLIGCGVLAAGCLLFFVRQKKPDAP